MRGPGNRAFRISGYAIRMNFVESLQACFEAYLNAGAKTAEESLSLQASTGPQNTPKPKAPKAPEPGPSRSAIMTQASAMTANTPNVRLGPGATYPNVR